MQSFHVHFMYNFLMDYYHNEIIVEKQKSNLKKLLKENQVLTRDSYHRFIVAWLFIGFCSIIEENMIELLPYSYLISRLVRNREIKVRE
jgi:hypothetical protein